MARIKGTPGNDSILGTNGNDTITSYAGNDTINSLFGRDEVQAGAGNDLLIVNYSAANDGIVTGGRSNGFYTTQGGTHFVTGWSGSVERFNVTGTSGNDTFSTDDGNDTLNGGAGNDYLDGAAGVDVFSGGAGTDTLEANFSAYSNGKSLVAGSGVLPSGGSFSSIEAFRVTMGNGNDTVSLDTAFDHYVTAGIGNDRVTTGGGDDTILAGGGSDIISTGLGQDEVQAGDGSDLLIVNYASANDGILTGGRSNGFYTTQGGVNFVSGWSGSVERFDVTATSGNDTFSTDDGNDTLNGGAGNDYMDGAAGADIYSGGAGTDTLEANFSGLTTGKTLTAANSGNLPSGGTFSSMEAFRVTMGSGDDTVTLATTFDHSVTAGIGNDQITTGGGDDTLITEAGDDVIATGLGMDEVQGGAGSDLLIVNYSTANDGILTGGRSNGFYTTQGGANYVGGWSGSVERFDVTATSGNDTFSTDDGNDTLNGGSGDDYMDGAAGADVYSGGAGTDTLEANFSGFTTGKTLTAANSGTLPGGGTFSSMEAFRVTMGKGNDTVTLATAFNHSVTSGDGNDRVTTGGGNDTLITGVGEDVIATGLGRDFVQGGSGTDLLIVNYSKANDGILTGGRSNGFYTTQGAANYVSGWSGNVERFDVTGTSGDDVFSTDDKNDTLNGGAGNDRMDGAGGADVYVGGSGTDTLEADFSGYTSSKSVISASKVLPGGGTFSSIEAFVVTMGNGNDTVTLATEFGNRVTSGNGNDIITTGSGADTVVAGDGADVIAAGLGLDEVQAGTGIDLLIVDYSHANDGNLVGGTSNGFFKTSGNSNIVTGWSGSVEKFDVTGTAGDDDFLTGDDNDTLNGGAGSDKLTSGTGDDLLDGTGSALGAGEKDTLTGEGGADLFVLGSAAAVYYAEEKADDYAFVADFSRAQGDKLQLKGAAADYILGANPDSGMDVFFDSNHNQQLDGNDDLVAIVDTSALSKTLDVKYV